METHFDFPLKLGMVVNKEKTELLFMKRRNEILPENITVGTDVIKVQKTLKALGIAFDFDLSWKTHTENLQ